MPKYRIKTGVWKWPAAQAAWYFVTIDKKVSEAIRELRSAEPRRGFGAVRVVAKVGKTVWQTSIFPDKRSGCYVLPLKASVRKKEKIFPGETVVITIEIKRGISVRK